MITEDKQAIVNEVIAYCDKEDKSTEFMIQLAIDKTNCSHEEIIDYLAYSWEEIECPQCGPDGSIWVLGEPGCTCTLCKGSHSTTKKQIDTYYKSIRQ